MNEKYHKWNPIEGIEKEMWVEALHDDYEGLRILLRGNAASSAILSISFPHYYMYRNADESYRIKLWENAEFEERGWSLCRTSSSQLIDWLSEESGEMYKKEEMMHYLIKTGADVIEIVTNQTPPNVKWLNAPTSEAPDSAVLVKRGKRGSYYDKN